MCRWFVYVSDTEECLLEDVLINPTHALTKQVHDHYLPKLFSHDPSNITSAHEVSARNRLFNVDGFGVAWYTMARNEFNQSNGIRPALYKTSQPPTHDTNFQSICANTTTKACFAHIRAASSTATISVNNHPFVFGRHAIMHNGVISDFTAIKRDMVHLLDDDSYANVNGATDSEHLAALYISHLTDRKGNTSWEKEYPVNKMEDALCTAIFDVLKIQKKVLGEEAEPNSLNVAVTDGSQVVAIRFRNHAIEQPPSLYWSTSAGVTLNRKYPDHPNGEENPDAYKKTEEHGDHVIIASEPSTYKKEEWDLIPKNHILTVSKTGKVSVKEVQYPTSWNAMMN
ncbi:MAG: hypothetical protein M1834_005073 [Cirrosporium novae-zelandiae]|nr:MAG: hypothetical protein M1834_005073 [Cirrosporium novae-zelandiae]